MKKLCAVLSVVFLYGAPAHAGDDIYRRVVNTRIVQCGYVQSYPFVWFNPKKNKLDGITVDYIEQNAKTLGFRVMWTASVNPASIATALRSARIDMICTPLPLSADTPRGYSLVGTGGLMPAYLYVAEKSRLADDKIAKARIAYIDTPEAANVIPEKYRAAKLIKLPEKTTMVELLDHIKYAKADAVVATSAQADEYLKQNAKAIKRYNNEPLWRTPLYFAVSSEDRQWGLLAKALTDMRIEDNANRLNQILKNSTVDPALFKDPSTP